MKRHIVQADWIDFLDDSLNASRRCTLEAHLRECQECSQKLEALRGVEAGLRSRAAELRQVSLEPDGAATSVKQSGKGTSDPFGIKITSILATICGVETSQRVWRIAGTRASAELAADRVADKSAVLCHLRSLVGPLYGEHAARLIWEFGMQVQRSEM